MTRKQGPGPGPGQPPLQRQRRIRERNRNIVVDPKKKISGGLGRKRFLKWYANCLIWLLKLYLDLDWIVYFSCLLPRRVHCTFIADELHPPPVVRWRVRRRRLYMQSFFRIHTWYYVHPWYCFVLSMMGWIAYCQTTGKFKHGRGVGRSNWRLCSSGAFSKDEHAHRGWPSNMALGLTSK